MTLHTEDYPTAINALQQYMANEPEETEGQLLLGKAYIGAQQYEAARDQAQKILDLTQDDGVVKRASLLQGEALFQLEDYDAAEQLLVPIAKAVNLYQNEAFYLLGQLYHKKGKLKRAYRMMKAAQIGHHKNATPYILTQLHDYVHELYTNSLADNAAAIEAHATAPIVQALKSSVWSYKDFQSQKLGDFNPEQVANIKDSLSTTTLLLTEKGAAILSGDSVTLYTYQLDRQKESSAIVSFIPLDKMPTEQVKLILTAAGTLTYSKEKGEVLVFEATAPTALPDAIQALFQQYTTAKDLQLLGGVAAQVVDQWT